MSVERKTATVGFQELLHRIHCNSFIQMEYPNCGFLLRFFFKYHATGNSSGIKPTVKITIKISYKSTLKL